jgi:hypothetical protein
MMLDHLALVARVQRLNWRVRNLQKRLAAAEESSALYQEWYGSGVHIIAGMAADLEYAEKRAEAAERALAVARAVMRPAVIQPVLPTAAAGRWSGRISLYAAAGLAPIDPASIPDATVLSLQERGAVAS